MSTNSSNNITQELEKTLTRDPQSAWHFLEEQGECYKLAESYMTFLRRATTERLCVSEAIKLAEECGFKPLSSFTKLAPGDKVWEAPRMKNLFLSVIGSSGVKEGFNVLASHVDSPRLDLKPNPLCEDGDSSTAYFKTHYYGGLKKYQWVQTPLALVGIVVLKSGITKEISIGMDPNDPIFMIPDLLPHLAGRVQGNLQMGEIIKGEQLNVICGSIPIKDEKVKNKVKFSVLRHLNQEYGMTELDFQSAELEVVPAIPPRYVGFDRSMISAYGQDDRICAFSNVKAITEIKDTPKRTAVVFLTEKEEVGSHGATGMDSITFFHALSKLVYLSEDKASDLLVRDILSRSVALSTDVTAGVDPSFREVHEMRNAAKLGFGPTICKYTGARGKTGGNDCDAEYLGLVRKLFDDNNIVWQIAEMGKVDEGGGNTISWLLSRNMIHTVDLGPPLIGMHSPYELSSVADLLFTEKACRVFLEKFVPQF